MFETLAIICSLFFLLSFIVLFRKALAKFFSFLFSPIKRKIAKRKKEKQRRLAEARAIIVPKLVNTTPVEKLPPPPSAEENDKPQKEEVESEEESFKYIKERVKSLQSQTGESFANEQESAGIDSDLNRISKSYRMIDPDKISPVNRERLSRFNQEEYLPPFIKSRLESDENAILAKRRQMENIKKQSVEKFLKEKKTPAEVEIDGKKIDLSNLPPNIKKLLIAGILNKKDF